MQAYRSLSRLYTPFPNHYVQKGLQRPRVPYTFQHGTQAHEIVDHDLTQRRQAVLEV